MKKGRRQKKKRRKEGQSSNVHGHGHGSLANSIEGKQGRDERELQEFLRQVQHSCTAISYSLSSTVFPDGYFHTLCSLLAKNITLEELDLSNAELRLLVALA